MRRQRELEALQGELLVGHEGPVALAEVAREPAPEVTPEVAPGVTLEVAPEVTPEVAPGHAPPAPVAAPMVETTPGAALEAVAPVSAPPIPSPLASPPPDAPARQETRASDRPATPPPEAASPPDAPGSGGSDRVAPDDPPEAAPDLPAGIPPAPPSDRWARAFGHRSPGRTGARGAGVKLTEGSRPNGEGTARAPNGQELHESARDHAAASVRPAGEPLARAKELVQQGRVDEAIDLYLGILTVNPSNLKAHNNLGVLFDELRQYVDALEHFEAAERIAPDSVEVLSNYASTLTSVARYDEAEALLRRAQKIDADGINVRLAIGILYFRRGLYAQAETELRSVCARGDDIGPAFYYRGEALNRLGRYDEARQAMERAKVLMPNDPRPFYTLGHLYDRQHQAEEAAEMYRHARRLQKR